MHIIISETSLKIQPISPFYRQEMRRHANILGGDGPEYTLRTYAIANTFSYSMQTRFHSFEMCQFRIQQEWVALSTLP